MKREELESMREDIIATLSATYKSAAHAHNIGAEGYVDIQKLNAFHELVCRELDHTHEPHECDELHKAIEVARGHLMYVEFCYGTDAEHLDAAMAALNGVVAKGGA